jgi:hypothetical protein
MECYCLIVYTFYVTGIFIIEPVNVEGKLYHGAVILSAQK